MTYYSGSAYCCLWIKLMGRLICICALTPWHIFLVIHIAAFVVKVSVDQLICLRLCHDTMFWQNALLPTGKADRSNNTDCNAFAMTYCSDNTYCCLWAKRIGRSIRISALRPWYNIMAIYIATYRANVSVDQYVFLHFRHDIIIIIAIHISAYGANVSVHQ